MYHAQPDSLAQIPLVVKHTHTARLGKGKYASANSSLVTENSFIFTRNVFLQLGLLVMPLQLVWTNTTLFASHVADTLTWAVRSSSSG